MSSFRCRLGLHDWNKYGAMISAYGGLTQFRSCKRCNKIDYARRYGNQANQELINTSIGKNQGTEG